MVFPQHRDFFSYLSMNGSRQACLKHSDVMNDLLAGPLTHFFIDRLLLGGSGMTYKCLA